MNEALGYVSQLASGRILWNEHSQASGILRDLNTLVPFAVAMKIDFTPWLDWIAAHSMETKLWSTSGKTSTGSVRAINMATWSSDWRLKMGFGAQQAQIFLEEWSRVLSEPWLEDYRQSLEGRDQLSTLAAHIYTESNKHVEGIRLPWACATLRLYPYIAVSEVAFNAWSEATPEERTVMNPTWAQWYELFGDQEGFLQCIRQESRISEETLLLPDDLQVEPTFRP